mmetsp:Transcript_31222/g.89492  ORF Transcript_31222/g.89492 Transcript_31222/m.89492 type:complete len:217 (+) Transcript_31222:1027-1677(+)
MVTPPILSKRLLKVGFSALFCMSITSFCVLFSISPNLGSNANRSLALARVFAKVSTLSIFELRPSKRPSTFVSRHVMSDTSAFLLVSIMSCIRDTWSLNSSMSIWSLSLTPLTAAAACWRSRSWAPRSAPTSEVTLCRSEIVLLVGRAASSSRILFSASAACRAIRSFRVVSMVPICSLVATLSLPSAPTHVLVLASNSSWRFSSALRWKSSCCFS